MRAQLWTLIALCTMAAAQDRPQAACTFDGFGGDIKLGEVSHAGTAYFGCSSATKCTPGKLAAGDIVVLYRTEGQWTCGYVQQRSGAGPAWIPARDLHEIAADRAPKLDAWLGPWTDRSGRIVITKASPPGHLHLTGEAQWHGRADVVHTGNFEGDVLPAGNQLHFVEDGADSCMVDLTLIGRYLVANDNNRCGGMNVRFWGIWTRASK